MKLENTENWSFVRLFILNKERKQSKFYSKLKWNEKKIWMEFFLKKCHCCSGTGGSDPNLSLNGMLVAAGGSLFPQILSQQK